MRVTDLTTLAQLEAIAPQWHDLALASHHASPYMVPAYLLPWIRRLDTRWACRATAVWDGEALVGLAPMMTRRVGGPVLGLRMICSPEVAPSPPFEILTRPGSETRVAGTLMAHWMVNPAWDAIELASVPKGTTSLQALAEAASARGMETREADDLRFFCVETASRNWDDYHAALSKKHRQNLRRGWRHFERLGSARIRTFPAEMDMDAARGATRHVIARSWKDDEGSGGWNQFVEEVLDGFSAAGLLRASFLEVNGVPVAYMFDVTWKDNVFAVQNGYDLSAQVGNPGQLLLANSIRLAHESGARRYVTGNRDYLRHWSEHTLDTVRLRIRRPSAISAARLALYDVIHHHRQSDALRAADETKDRRKRSVRSSGAATEAEDI